MSRFLRGWAILWVVFRYGLDELVLSGLPHPALRKLRSVLTFGRKLDKPRGQRLREALEELGKVFAAEGVPFAGDTIERNVVYEGVIETAQAEGCDLIVMASHGRQGVKALVLGSVAQKVLTHTRLPVLIVKD